MCVWGGGDGGRSRGQPSTLFPPLFQFRLSPPPSPFLLLLPPPPPPPPPLPLLAPHHINSDGLFVETLFVSVSLVGALPELKVLLPPAHVQRDEDMRADVSRVQWKAVIPHIRSSCRHFYHQGQIIIVRSESATDQTRSGPRSSGSIEVNDMQGNDVGNQDKDACTGIELEPLLFKGCPHKSNTKMHSPRTYSVFRPPP